MSEDFDLVVQSRKGSNLIVARAFGVVVRSTDLQAGIKEAVERIAEVDKLYREEGVEPELSDDGLAGRASLQKDARRSPASARIMDVLPQALVSGVVISCLILVASIPIFSVLARLNRTLEDVTGNTSNSAIQNIGRNAVDFIIRTGDVVDKVTPQRKEELRLAVRKIMNGLAPIIQEVGDSVEHDAPTEPPAR
jgi:hypothetical protein